MPGRRDAILHGTREAARLHRDLDTRRHVVERGGNVDIFGAIVSRSIPLVFRPLEGLLGLYVPAPCPGIMVTTQRSLSVQRFTAAHELGHAVMRHRASFDDESILHRFGKTAGGVSDVEIAADAFAAAFLMPRWLLEIHASRQEWNRVSMADPTLVYQMALRIGASYEATCWALERHKIIGADVARSHIKVPPRSIKRRLLDGHGLPNWHPDVWLLTERDQDSVVEGGPADVFVVRVRENSSAGYLWNFEELQAAGFAIVRDQRIMPQGVIDVGGAVDRLLTAQSEREQTGSVALVQARPWELEKEPLSRLSFTYDLLGKESGLPRAERRRLEAAA